MNKSFFLTLLATPVLLFCQNQRYEFSSRPISTDQQAISQDLQMTSFYGEEPPFNDALPPFYSQNLPPVYYPIQYHMLSSVSAMGNEIEIEDGSVWRISPDQSDSILTWKQDDPIIITQNRNWFSHTSFAFLIVNEANKQSVYANLHLGPYVESPHTHHVIAIDHSHGHIVLENQSIWNISSYDSNIFEEWHLYDAIILGTNSSWTSSKQLLLINVNTNSFVRADLQQ